MATPRVSENAATQRQYVSQLTLSAALTAALRQLWAATTPNASEAAWDTFTAATRAILPQYAQAAAVVSLDNYRAARAAAGITTTPKLPRVTPPPASKIDAGLAWAKRAEADLADIEAAILQRADAAMQKVLLDEARETTVAAVEGDDRALGFRRVPRPDACAWCLALAIRTSTRGTGDDEHWGVFKSRASAGQIPPNVMGDTNRFHNNCHCVVEPIFDAASVPLPWLVEMRDTYNDTDDFNHFRRVIEARRRGRDIPDPRPQLAPASASPEQVSAVANLLANIDAAMRAA